MSRAALFVLGVLGATRLANAEPVRVVVEAPYYLGASIDREQHGALEPVCSPTCTAWLDTQETYRARLSTRLSPPFHVTPTTARISLSHDERLADFGFALLAGGVLSTLIGLTVIRWGGDGFSCSQNETVGCVGDGMTIAGLSALGVAIAISLIAKPVNVTLHQRSVALSMAGIHF